MIRMCPRSAWRAATCLFAISVLLAASAQEVPSGLRFTHQASDAPMVDIVIDGQSVARDVAFGDITSYHVLPPGRHEVAIYPHRLPSRDNGGALPLGGVPPAEGAGADQEQAGGDPAPEDDAEEAAGPDEGAEPAPAPAPAPRVIEPIVTFVTVEPGKHYTAVLTGFYEPPAEEGELGHLSISVSPANTQLDITGPRGYAAELTGDQLLRGIQPGAYTVTASLEGYQPSTYEAEVHPRRTTTVSISLQEGDAAAEPATEAVAPSGNSETWATLQVQVFEDAFGGVPAAGRSHLRIVHASPTSPTVDVQAVPVAADGAEAEPVQIARVGYPGASGYLSVPAGTYVLRYGVQGSDQALLEIPDIALASGAVYTFFLTSEPTGSRPRVVASIDATVAQAGFAP